MLFVEIPAVLDRQQVAQARETLGRARFVDGGVTGATVGPQVKRNRQIAGTREELQPLLDLVQNALLSRDEFTGHAFPKKLHLNFNAYTGGETYGDHNDAAVVGGGMAAAVRTDLSFTLFLSDPGEYDGGEMVIQLPTGEAEVKLPAGDAILYFGGTVHRVAPVTRGERLAAFGWAQSFIRDAAQREILTQLRYARRDLMAAQPDAPALATLGNAYNNLMRMWTDN